MMRNLLFTIRYDGRSFHGFQVQRNAPTVAGAFQDAVERVFGSRLDIKGCSRTDSGVHANRFCISMKTESPIPCERAVAAMNGNLPRTIAVTGCREVAPDFHARYSAVGKRYLYRVLNAPVRDPFWEGLALHYPYRLDAQALSREAEGFLGTHDFAAFQNTGSAVTETVRTVTGFTVAREGDFVLFWAEGNGFLYNMVRIMVGTLLDIQRGAVLPGAIPGIIKARDRFRAGATAPAHGLYLDDVFYDL